MKTPTLQDYNNCRRASLTAQKMFLLQQRELNEFQMEKVNRELQALAAEDSEMSAEEKAVSLKRSRRTKNK